MTPNQRTMTLKLKRIEVCDLMIACTAISESVDEKDAEKWNRLHDKLYEMLDNFDRGNGFGAYTEI